MGKKFRKRRRGGITSRNRSKRSYKRRIGKILHKSVTKSCGKQDTDTPESPHEDKSPNDKWIIVELLEDVSLENHHEQVASRLREVLGPEAEFFIPVYSERVGDKDVAIVLCDGYVYVKSTPVVEENIMGVHDDRIKGPLMYERRLTYTDTAKIEEYRSRIKNLIYERLPCKGQTVIAREGDYKNLEGRVVSVNRKKLIARVIFKRLSRIVSTPMRIINLQVVSFI